MQTGTVSKAKFIESENPLVAAVRSGVPREHLPVKPVRASHFIHTVALSGCFLKTIPRFNQSGRIRLTANHKAGIKSNQKGRIATRGGG